MLLSFLMVSLAIVDLLPGMTPGSEQPGLSPVRTVFCVAGPRPAPGASPRSSAIQENSKSAAERRAQTGVWPIKAGWRWAESPRHAF